MSWKMVLAHHASTIYEHPHEPLVYIDQVEGRFSASMAQPGAAPVVLEDLSQEDVQTKLEAWRVNPDEGWR